MRQKGITIYRLEELGGDIKKKRFLKAEHTVRHKSGIKNTIWTDMMIETTLIKTAKSPGQGILQPFF